mmetsp:Transcript_2299/g.9010  ORF Transcript_2299/g.9010 Transcript_2299/m.9010 type:complete len:243 (-) Transcript_2299:298-1026(-)
MDVNSGLCRVLKPSLRNTRPSSYTRSKPPTTSRLRCNSVAIRSVSCMPSALWKVLKGFASAPPACVCSTGVSISKNPSSSSIRRMVEMMFERALNVFRTSGDTIKSTYRCRYRFSTSCNPCHLSGNGSSAFVNICTLAGTMDSSPLSLLFTLPCTPMMSPTSTSSVIISNAPGLVSSNRFLSQNNCTLPRSSTSDKNANFPNDRFAITLPHTASLEPSISTPFSNPSCSLCSASQYFVRSNR